MRVLDLFSGIGGFSLGLDRAGMETVAFCEIEDYPVTILNKHWPDVPVYRDVRKLTGEKLEQEVGRIDVICGGFPCQPFSVAGRQKGKEDDRHLWPEMFRLIQEIRPRWVIGENVSGFVRMALDDVLSDLESEGYTTQSFVIPACAVGGIHRRDRCWIVAHTGDNRGGDCEQRGAGESCEGREETIGATSSDEATGSGEASGTVANSEHDGQSQTKKQRKHHGDARTGKEGQEQTFKLEGVCVSESMAHSEGRGRREKQSNPRGSKTGVGSSQHEARRFEPSGDAISMAGRRRSQQFRPIPIPTEPPVRHRDDGLPNNMARLKALGNAVVPQIPELIGRYILEVEEKN